MSPMFLTRRFCCMAVALAIWPAQAFAAGVPLAPHRAYYVLEAARIDSKAGISAIAGKLAYEITGNECDGYAVSYRIANRYQQGENPAQVIDIRMTSFESGDGKELDSQQKQFNDMKLEADTRVKAKFPKEGGAGSGELEGKESKSFDIDAAALLPTAFQKKLMQDALDGNARSSALVFEGSDSEKVVKAISVIGTMKTNGKIASGADVATLSSLNGLSFWPVSVSYYDLDAKDDEPPTYTASYNMLENGVSTDLVLDYGSYALSGKLEKIEMLKAENCK
jgi:hypothetical protein